MTDRDRDYTSTGRAPLKSPVAFSVLLHSVIILVALVGWDWTHPTEEAPPRSIAATLIVQQPEIPVAEPVSRPDPDVEQQRQEERRRQEEAERRAAAEREAQQERERQEAQRRERERQEAAEQERQRQAEAEEAARQKAQAEAEALAQQRAEEERQRQEEVRKAEEERRRQQELERQRREQEERERQEAEARRREQERQLQEQQLEALAAQSEQRRQEEARRQAAAAQAAQAREAQMVSDRDRYQILIRNKLQQAWYMPPSATRNMSVQLRISLLPTGELASVQLVQGSGNAAFDNSALSAVRGVGRYPIPDDRDTFERYFRQFTIEFTPEGLR